MRRRLAVLTLGALPSPRARGERAVARSVAVSSIASSAAPIVPDAAVLHVGAWRRP